MEGDEERSDEGTALELAQSLRLLAATLQCAIVIEPSGQLSMLPMHVMDELGGAAFTVGDAERPAPGDTDR